MSTKYVLALDQGTTSSVPSCSTMSRISLRCSSASLSRSIRSRLGGAQPHGDLVHPVWSHERGGGPERCRCPRYRRHWHHQPAGDHHLWEKATGRPIYNAIVWQCRRTAPLVDELLQQPGMADYIRENTGLMPDAYFSATKIKWILDNVPVRGSGPRQGRSCSALWTHG